jgi:hypothetical protein
LRETADHLDKPARPNKPAISRLTDEGSGAGTKVGENTGLADPGEFSPKL